MRRFHTEESYFPTYLPHRSVMRVNSSLSTGPILLGILSTAAWWWLLALECLIDLSIGCLDESNLDRGKKGKLEPVGPTKRVMSHWYGATMGFPSFYPLNLKHLTVLVLYCSNSAGLPQTQTHGEQNNSATLSFSGRFPDLHIGKLTPNHEIITSAWPLFWGHFCHSGLVGGPCISQGRSSVWSHLAGGILR